MGDSPEIIVLGPVTVRAGGGTRPVRSRPQRIVLACLALRPGRVVSTVTLIDALWPDDPPAGASGNLHSYVSKLRRLVGSDRIRHETGGYRLDIDPAAVDAVQVEHLAAVAERADATTRADLLAQALDRWVGEPLADLDDVPVLQTERTRLAALRQELELRRLAALTDAGDPAAALPDLRAAADRDPHDEAVATLLARALHGTGRTAEALRSIHDFRTRVVADTGLDPSADLTHLERSLLTEDPPRTDVDPPAPTATDWPRPTTPLHGRDTELARLDELVAGQRLVTLAGTGGVGKSRLAGALADRRSTAGQSVHFLALASLTPNDDLAARLAAAFGLRVPQHRAPADALHERIGSGGQLLVLDNCEHVLDGARRIVADLLARRSDLSVLTTSRTPLGLAGECVVRVTPLDPDDAAARDLFVERARRVQPGFEPRTADDEAAIRSLVRGLGGLPLAIELAAGRMASMVLPDLAARIDDLDLLTGGRPTERHRTLRGAIDWSYRLLPEPARRLLRTLSVFPAGVDLGTVEELAGALELPDGGATLAVTLADASLLDVDLGSATRYSMLEPVRAFAGERLVDVGEVEEATASRAAWAQRTASWIEEASRSPDEAAADARLRRELANLRAAHRASTDGGELDTAITISSALARPATARDLPEIWSWALELADHPSLPGHPRSADALGAAATAAWLTGDLARGEELASDGLRRDAGSVPCLQALASIRLFLGHPAEAHHLWMEASRPHGAYLPQAALAAVYLGDDSLARRSLAEADGWAAGVGSPAEIALCRYAWGELLGPDPAAIGEYEAAIELAAGVGATFVSSISRVGLASTLAANGHRHRAVEEFDAAVRYWRTTGNWTQQWTTLRNVADLLGRHSRQATAERIRSAAAGAPAAASPRRRADADAAEPVDPRAGGSPEELVAVVLAELAELRR